MTRTLGLAAVLASAAGVAGSPAGCEAQTGPQPLGMSLSIAIGEAWQSPFHAASRTGGSGDARLDEIGGARPGGVGLGVSFPSYTRQSTEEDEEPIGRPVIVFTLAASVVSHVAAVYLISSCVESKASKRPVIGCILGPAFPVPMVAAPALSVGIDPGKAFKASAFGLLGGAAAYGLTILAKRDIERLGAVIPSSIVHFLTMRAMLG